MALSATKSRSLAESAGRAVEESPTLDKAIAHLAGVLYPTFFLERVSLCMQLRSGHLVLAAVWTRRLSRLGKGTTLRAAATALPEVIRLRRVVCSVDTANIPAAAALHDEGIEAWASIPMPRPEKIEGMLTLGAKADVFSKQRAFLTELGVAAGPRLVELARQSPVFRAAQDRL